LAKPKRPTAYRLDPATEAVRRRTGRNRAFLVVVLLFALLLYGLAMVKITSHGLAGAGLHSDPATRQEAG
jgi:hypothetical protein